MAKVSIQIPVYNGEKYLVKTLQSVADNAPPDSEVIIMDDGSKDNSCAIIKEFVAADSRFVFEEKKPGESLRVVMVKNCNAEYIIPFDHDDIFLPGREDHIAFLDENPEFSGAYGITLRAHNGNVAYYMGKKFSNFLMFSDKNPCGNGSITIRRKAMEDAGGFIVPYIDEYGRLMGSGDWFLTQRLGTVGSLHFITKPAYLYRIHANQQSRDSSYKNSKTKEIALTRLKEQFSKEIQYLANGDMSLIERSKIAVYTQIAGLYAANLYKSDMDFLPILKKAMQINPEDWGIKRFEYYHHLKNNDFPQLSKSLSEIVCSCGEDALLLAWVVERMADAASRFQVPENYLSLIKRLNEHIKELQNKFNTLPAVTEGMAKYY